MADQRAISDAIGYVLVFAIIISTLAVVYAGGFQSLDNARQFERMNNAERAFEVFADNVEDITQRGAPSRATEVKLAQASLQGGPAREIMVNVTRHNDGTINSSPRNRTYRPVIYESQTDQSNEMIYELGATLRSSSGGTTMSTEPTWIIGDSKVIIPIVQTTFEGGGNITGSQAVLIRTTHAETEVLVDNTTKSSDVFVTIRTPRAGAWRTYLEDKGMTCPDAENTDDEVHCEITDVETVYLTRIVVDYHFES